MAEIVGLLRGEAVPQFILGFQGVFGGGKAQQVGDADAVGITDISRLVEDIPA